MFGTTWVIVGGCVGSVCFSLLRASLPHYTGGVTLPSLFEQSYLPMGIFVGALGALIGRDVLLARQDPLEHSSTSWRSYGAGVLVGLMQIPAIYLIRTCVGNSSAFMTLPALPLRAIGLGNDTLVQFSSFSKNYWQLSFNVGIALGSALCHYFLPLDTQDSSSEDDPIVRQPWKQVLSKFAGGFLFLLGSRLADGCTSGHGISGLATLSVTSLITVISMFASGNICQALCVPPSPK